jgi:hypothetical protein
VSIAISTLRRARSVLARMWSISSPRPKTQSPRHAEGVRRSLRGYVYGSPSRDECPRLLSSLERSNVSPVDGCGRSAQHWRLIKERK